MEYGIEFSVGATLLLLSLSALTRTKQWLELFEKLEEGKQLSALRVGALSFFLSSLVVGLHPVWEGRAFIVTAIGLGGMIESTLYLLYPSTLSVLWKPFISSQRPIQVLGYVCFLVSLVILYDWAVSLQIIPWRA